MIKKPKFKFAVVGALLLCLVLSIDCSAQTDPETFRAKNAIYLEVGGSSGIYAINYSKIFHQKGKIKLNASAGFSMWPSVTKYSKTSWLPAIPLELSAFYGKSKHHLELGFGFTSYLDRTLDINSETFEFRDKVVFAAIVPLRIGYRYQKPEGGFFYRVAYTPFVNLPVGGREDWVFTPIFAGISFGKSF